MKTNVRKRVRVVIAMIAMCSLLAGSTLGVFAAGDGAWKTSKSRYSFLTSSQTKTFNKAVKGLTGVSYEPVAVVAKQTVAGTNYVYLCKGTTVTKKPVMTNVTELHVYHNGNNCEIIYCHEWTTVLSSSQVISTAITNVIVLRKHLWNPL